MISHDRLLTCLYGEEEDVEFDSASDLIEAAWRFDPGKCQSVLLDTLRDKSFSTRLTDEIRLAADHIADSAFDQFLYEIVHSSGLTHETKHSINIHLVSAGHSNAIADFKNYFASACKRFLKGDLEELTIRSYVQQACILKQTELYPVLSDMITQYHALGTEKPYIHISYREYIETLSVWLGGGPEPMKDIINQRTKNNNKVEAAVFALGCDQDPTMHELLKSAHTNYTKTTQFMIRRECVGAIIYSSKPEDTASFLTKALANERDRISKQWLPRFWLTTREYDVCRLLRGAGYCPEITSSLEAEVRQWLNAEEDKYQVFAYLTLQDQGLDKPDINVLNTSLLNRERNFRKNDTSDCDLMTLRLR